MKLRSFSLTNTTWEVLQNAFTKINESVLFVKMDYALEKIRLVFLIKEEKQVNEYVKEFYSEEETDKTYFIHNDKKIYFDYYNL